MEGFVHSIQSLGAVDGPGVRSVVFLQGCALRCVYCHNPDTWEICRSGGKAQEPLVGQAAAAGRNISDVQTLTPEELVEKLLRFQLYWGKEGGVTISGGEPLLQAEFVAEVFRLLKEQGVHTTLDTAGQIIGEPTEKVLKYTDLALVDLKFLTELEYRAHTKGSRKKVEEFLEISQQLAVPIWIRHVVVPGLTAEPEYLRQIQQQAQKYSNLEKIEWLPFHNLCMEKYEKMGMKFPLADTPALKQPELEGLLAQI